MPFITPGAAGQEMPLRYYLATVILEIIIYIPSISISDFDILHYPIHVILQYRNILQIKLLYKEGFKEGFKVV